jgi:hypothetical protein
MVSWQKHLFNILKFIHMVRNHWRKTKQHKPHFDIYLQSNKMGVLSISCHLLHVYGSLLFLESHQPVEKCQRYLKIQANQYLEIYTHGQEPLTKDQVQFGILSPFSVPSASSMPYGHIFICPSLRQDVLWYTNVRLSVRFTCHTLT